MSSIYQKPAAVLRYLSYKNFHVPSLTSWTPSIGLMLLGMIGTVFFLSMYIPSFVNNQTNKIALTLGPKPYYWPNTPKISYGSSPPIATRTGWMALALLPIVMFVSSYPIKINIDRNRALSTKANLVSVLTGIPHEKLQVFLALHPLRAN